MYTLFRATRARLTASASAISISAMGLLALWTLGWVEPATANAAGPQTSLMGPAWGGPQQMKHLSRHLDLSDAQRERIREIMQGSRAEGEQLRSDLQRLRTELQAAIKADEFYTDQVRITIESQLPVMTELMLLGARTMHAVRAELTPEQQVEADALLEKFSSGGRRHGRRHRHGS